MTLIIAYREAQMHFKVITQKHASFFQAEIQNMVTADLKVFC